MALSSNRNTQQQGADLGPRQVYPLADNVIVYLGSLVVLDSAGNARPGYVATGLRAVGVANLAYVGPIGSPVSGPGTPGSYADNTRPGHAAGAVGIECRRGIFKFDNSAGDPVVAGDLGNACFVFDDHTVSHSDGGATQSVAGRVEQIDSDGGIWVNFQEQSVLAS